MRRWTVAGGIIETDLGVLLVQNRRKNGSTDWSTPGGVIDEGETVLEGLTREVVEETGLAVPEWVGPVYSVSAEAPEMRWTMRAEIYVAMSVSGSVTIDDPDGIVIDAAWVPHEQMGERLAGNQPWVVEPLGDYLRDRWDSAPTYHYRVNGAGRDDLAVERLHR